MPTKSKTTEKAPSAEQRRAPQPDDKRPNEFEQGAHPALALERAKVLPASALKANDILALQRSIGNRAVQRLLSSQPAEPPASASNAPPIIQAKLMVGPANDHYEQEADRIAQQVTSEPIAKRGAEAIQRQTDEEEPVRRKPLAASITPLVQRQQAPDEDKEIRTKRTGHGEGFAAGGELETRLQASRGSGSPLPATLRSRMERSLGSDFGSVRVHTGDESDRLNLSLSSHAFTTGQDLYFKRGEYQPGSQEGQKLIAHELTHVVQQKGSSTTDSRIGVSSGQNPTIQRGTIFGKQVEQKASEEEKGREDEEEEGEKEEEAKEEDEKEEDTKQTEGKAEEQKQENAADRRKRLRKEAREKDAAAKKKQKKDDRDEKDEKTISDNRAALVVKVQASKREELEKPATALGLAWKQEWDGLIIPKCDAVRDDFFKTATDQTLKSKAKVIIKRLSQEITKAEAAAVSQKMKGEGLGKENHDVLREEATQGALTLKKFRKVADAAIKRQGKLSKQDWMDELKLIISPGRELGDLVIGEKKFKTHLTAKDDSFEANPAYPNGKVDPASILVYLLGVDKNLQVHVSVESGFQVKGEWKNPHMFWFFERTPTLTEGAANRFAAPLTAKNLTDHMAKELKPVKDETSKQVQSTIDRQDTTEA